MELERLLGKYDDEEQELLNKIKQSRQHARHTTESRGGMMGIGKEMGQEYNFLPSPEKVDAYLEKRRGSLLHYGCK